MLAIPCVCPGRPYRAADPPSGSVAPSSSLSQGGRITISPSAALFDNIYERLVFLLAGAALELGTSDLLSTEGPSPGSKRPPTPGPPQEGQINGVVASRRARGDRIEIWLGGRKKKEPVPVEWLDRFKEVLANELDMPELRSSKYKKHF